MFYILPVAFLLFKVNIVYAVCIDRSGELLLKNMPTRGYALGLRSGLELDPS